MWHVFHSIATTICYCARGTTYDEPVPGWVEIVHKDLKPNNGKLWLFTVDSPQADQ